MKKQQQLEETVVWIRATKAGRRTIYQERRGSDAARHAIELYRLGWNVQVEWQGKVVAKFQH